MKYSCGPPEFQLEARLCAGCGQADIQLQAHLMMLQQLPQDCVCGQNA